MLTAVHVGPGADPWIVSADVRVHLPRPTAAWPPPGARTDLPASPEAIFDLEFFKKRPEPFYSLAQELAGADVAPTPMHDLLAALADSGRVQRIYTQNIDGLERRAGVPAELLVEAHGTVATAHCIACGAEAADGWQRAGGEVPRCGHCDGGLVKPDVVFFGEDLPARYAELVGGDVAAADFMLVAGTSLQVWPVAGMVHECRAPRLLVNRDSCVAPGDGVSELLMDCDEAVEVLRKALGL